MEIKFCSRSTIHSNRFAALIQGARSNFPDLSQDCVRAFVSDSILHPKDEDLSLGTPAWAIIFRSLRELLPLRGSEVSGTHADTKAH